MDYLEAIAKLKTVEGVDATVVDAIEDRVGSLTRESRSWRKRGSTAEEDLKRLNELLDKEGGDAAKVLTSLRSQIDKLTKANETLTSEKQQAVTDLENYKATTIWGEAASKAKIDKDAFLGLIEGGIIPRDKITIDGESIKIDGKSLQDFAMSKGGWVAKALAVQGSGDTANNNNNSTQFSGNQTSNSTSSTSAPTGGTNSNSNGGIQLERLVTKTFDNMGFVLPKTN